MPVQSCHKVAKRQGQVKVRNTRLDVLVADQIEKM